MIDRAKRYADRVSKSASDVTQTVVNRQNTLRRRLNERIKSVAAVDVANRDNWRLIVAQLSHERAVWNNQSDITPTLWQLNPTEGSQRERRRLERATRRIKSKFFRKTNSEDDSSNITHDHENASFPLEQFLKEDPAEDTHAVIEWLHTHEKIYVTEKCRRITPEHESHGEFLIAKGMCQHKGFLQTQVYQKGLWVALKRAEWESI